MEPLRPPELLRFWLQNVGELEPGLAYRSARPGLDLLEFLAGRAHLAHIICLTREPGPEAEAFVKAGGATLTHLPMSADRPPGPRQILELIRVTQRARAAGQALLIQCRAGADRTGMMAAIWRMLFQGASDRDALRREAFLFGHLEPFHPVVRHVIETFRPELFRPFLENPVLLDNTASVRELESRYFEDLPLISGNTRVVAGPLRAGAGKANLLEGWTNPVQLATYGPSPGKARRVREPVFARALLLDNGGVRLAIVSCDLLIIDEALRREALAGIEARGLAVDDLLLAATHTHTSIGGYVENRVAQVYMLGEFDAAMRSHLAGRIAEAVARAAAAARPARCGFGRAFVDDLSFNRRLGATIDPEVGIVKLTGADGKPLAVVVNFAAHPILEPADGTIAPDYPGRLAAILDERFGFGLFLGGALGDINARVPGEKEEWKTEGLAEKAAARLAAAVEEAAAAVETTDVIELASMTASVPLPPVNVGLIPDLFFPLDWLAGKVFDAPETVPLQVARIGQAAVVGSATELGVRLGLQLKRRSPSPFPFVVTHANAYASYAVEQTSHAKRKLDPSSVIFLYGPSYGQRIVEKACDLWAAQWGTRLDPAAKLISPAAVARVETETHGSSPAEREARREEAAAREAEETLADADPTLAQSRRFGARVGDSLPEAARLEGSFLYLEKLHGGDGVIGRRREAGGRLRLRGPWDLRGDVAAGYVRSEWEVPGGQDGAEGASDPLFGIERPFLIAESRLDGNAFRLVPRLETSAPAGEADADAPFAFAPGAGVWRPAAGGALELVWETYRTLSFETMYRTAVDRHRGRRPGDRWEGAVRFSERHGIASLHLELSAALQLPDRRHGGREEVDVDETSFELGLRPGISFHLGEHVELFAQARVPLARSGDGAGEGRGGLLGVMIGF